MPMLLAASNVRNFAGTTRIKLSYSHFLLPIIVMLRKRRRASGPSSLRARVGSLPSYYHILVLESGLRVKDLSTNGQVSRLTV